MPPLSLMIKPVSGLCNMRCTYCFYCDEMQRRQTAAFAPMTGETLENLVRRAFAYADGSVTLAFQGGEPTLAGADFFRRLLALERRCNSRRLPVTHALQTNGLHMDPDLLSVLQQGRFLVGVSMDGTRALHDSRRLDAAGCGTWDRVQQTTALLRKYRIEYNVLCVVDHALAQQGQAVWNSLKHHGFLQFIPCLDPLDGSPQPWSLSAQDYGRFLCSVYPLYAQSLRNHQPVSVRTFDNWLQMLAGYPPESCGMLGRCFPSYLVESDGSVYPCDFYALDEWRLGNVNEKSFFSLAKSPVLRHFCESSCLTEAECLSCPYHFLCRGGCRRDRSDPAMRTRLCAGLRMFFDRYLDDLRALAREIWQGGVL